MQIDGVYLLPQMNSTNTANDGAQMLNKEATFQEQLKAATKKLENTEIKTMSAEDIAKRNADIKEASKQLEAILLKMLYNEMWKTVPKDELFSNGNDNAMEIYRDMYNEELTKQMAEGGGVGLGDFIYRQLTETNPHRLY